MVIFESLLLLTVIAAGPQSRPVEIRVTGEHVMIGGETPETAKEFAEVDAARKAWQKAIAYLRDIPEAKTLRLKPGEFEAFVATILQVEERPTNTATAQDGKVYRVDALANLDPVGMTRRIAALHKDQEAANALVEMWTQMQESRLGLTELRVKHLAAQVVAALAKTEESFGSARVAAAAERVRAKQFAEESAVLGPSLADAHYAMGDVLTDAGQVEAGEAEYRKALSINPGSSFGHARLANALRLKGDLPASIAELREALRIDPTSASTHTDLGLILAAQDNTSEAIAEYRQALRFDPDFIDAHNNLAIALARQRKIPEAVAEFREIVRVDPDSALGYYNLGIALADMDEDQESAAALREVVRINPNHFNAHYNLGELLRLEGKYDDSVKQFREYLRLAPDTPQNQRNIRRAKEFIQTHENK